MVNDHGEMKVLKARNEGEDQKSFNKAGKIVLRSLDTKKRRLHKETLTLLASQVQKGS